MRYNPKMVLLALISIALMLIDLSIGLPEQSKKVSASEEVTRWTNSIGMEMVLVKPGKYTKGVDPLLAKIFKYLKPEPEEVKISKAFYIASTEVTNEQFEEFLKGADYKPKNPEGKATKEQEKHLRYLRRKNISFATMYADRISSEDKSPWEGPFLLHLNTAVSKDFRGSNKPVIFISWEDAQAFCKWLSEKEKRKYRLPTSKEWEYACRAGSKTKYFFSDKADELPKYAWFRENSEKHTHDVGKKQPNHWGLYDMLGNVWEWCQDSPPEKYLAEEIDGGIKVNYLGAIAAIVKGGGFEGRADYVVSSSESFFTIGNRVHYLGFRVICETE